jgi:hypothetical protein
VQEFLCVQEFLEGHAEDIGVNSSLDLDSLLEGSEARFYLFRNCTGGLTRTGPSHRFTQPSVWLREELQNDKRKHP